MAKGYRFIPSWGRRLRTLLSSGMEKSKVFCLFLRAVWRKQRRRREAESMMANTGRRHWCRREAGRDMMLSGRQRRGILEAGCSSTVRQGEGLSTVVLRG